MWRMGKDEHSPEMPNENSTVEVRIGKRALDREEATAFSDETSTVSKILMVAIQPLPRPPAAWLEAR